MLLLDDSSAVYISVFWWFAITTLESCLEFSWIINVSLADTIISFVSVGIPRMVSCCRAASRGRICLSGLFRSIERYSTLDKSEPNMPGLSECLIIM